MRISDWSSDVCSSDLLTFLGAAGVVLGARVPIILTSRADSERTRLASCAIAALLARAAPKAAPGLPQDRKSVVSGTSVSVSVVLGGRRIIKKKTNTTIQHQYIQ